MSEEQLTPIYHIGPGGCGEVAFHVRGNAKHGDIAEPEKIVSKVMPNPKHGDHAKCESCLCYIDEYATNSFSISA